MSKPTIGFIGLGIMGKPMALNLVKAGYQLVVHDISQPPVAELVEAGAAEAPSPQEIAEQSDVVITMLPDSPDVELVALGEDGGSFGKTMVVEFFWVNLGRLHVFFSFRYNPSRKKEKRISVRVLRVWARGRKNPNPLLLSIFLLPEKTEK